MREKRSIWISCNINYKFRCLKSLEKWDYCYWMKLNLELYMLVKVISDVKSCKVKKYRIVGFF